jgi:hypothetical protein
MTIDWYPSPEPTPGTPEPGNYDSRVFERLDETDYLARRGAVGDMPVAGPLRRIGALLIDFLASVYAPFMACELLGIVEPYKFGVIAFVVFANESASFPGCQSGQTLGRHVFGLQAARVVVSDNGRQAIVDRGLAMNFLRAALHIVDMLLFFVAIPWVVATRYHRTLADSLTKTVIIRPAQLERLQPAPYRVRTIA